MAAEGASPRHIADRAFDVLASSFDGRSGTFREPTGRTAALWPVANCLAAVAAYRDVATGTYATRCADLARRSVGAMQRYRVAERGGVLLLASSVQPPLIGPLLRRLRVGESYFDDAAWVALSLLALREPEDTRLVELARRIERYVLTGWSNDTSWWHPGGLRWADAAWSQGRNACSNGPGAAVAARLYLLTHEATWLEWSLRIFDWTWSTLRRDDGLVADGIAPDGTRNDTVWSYNQGSVLGAAVLLAEATGAPRLADAAAALARASLTRYGDGVVLAAEPPVFAAVYLRNLLIYAAMRPLPEATALLERYVGSRHDANDADAKTELNAIAADLLVASLRAGARAHP